MNPEGPRQPTLKTIAREAGVHPSTVSRALSGHPDGRVPAATVARIRLVAEELGYEPNPWARSLRTNRTMTIGLVIPRLTDVVLAHIFEAAEVRASEFGYQAITVATKQADQAQTVRRLIDRRVDGLVLATPEMDDPLLPKLASDGFPFVLVNRASGAYPTVRGDDETGGYMATKHLLGLGHARVAHLAGPQNTSTGSLRLKGYRRALREAGRRFSADLVRYGNFDATSALEAADQLLRRKSPPSAIFAINDISALATMACARRNGLKVPDDLAVVGYNDSETAALLPIPLTSVHVPLMDMGRCAVDQLLERLAGRPAETIVLEPTLVARESTATLPR